jgi:hypothetical protein
VWLILEKIVLAGVIPALALLGANPMAFHLKQRISGVIAVIAIGCFVAFTIEKRGISPAPSPPPPPSTVNRTSGPESPIMPNNSGTVNINSEPANPEHPPPKE